MKQIALLETGDTIAVSALGGQLVGTFGGYDADDETLNIEISAPIRGGRIQRPHYSALRCATSKPSGNSALRYATSKP